MARTISSPKETSGCKHEGMTAQITTMSCNSEYISSGVTDAILIPRQPLDTVEGSWMMKGTYRFVTDGVGTAHMRVDGTSVGSIAVATNTTYIMETTVYQVGGGSNMRCIMKAYNVTAGTYEVTEGSLVAIPANMYASTFDVELYCTTMDDDYDSASWGVLEYA